MTTGWVVDLRHFLAPTGAIAEMPAPARRMAEFFASIVVEATSNLDGPPGVKCRRRPGRRRCAGLLEAHPSPLESEAIEWHCPECGDYGVIRGWAGSLWDGTAENRDPHAAS